MFKSSCIIFFLLFSSFNFGQEVTFHPNVSHAAKGLKQNLNTSKDRLVLESKKIIRQVDILNDDFLKSIDFNSKKASIDLSTLPNGNYILQARIKRKRIIMYLEKTNKSSLKIVKTNPKKIEVGKMAMVSKKKSDTNEKKLSPKERIIEISKGKNNLFWVVYEDNSGFGSSKTMSLENKDEIFNLIEKIKLELNTKRGRNNKLLVYEIYNKSKFKSKQYRNSKFYKKKKSKLFNVKPIYSSSQHE